MLQPKFLISDAFQGHPPLLYFQDCTDGYGTSNNATRAQIDRVELEIFRWQDGRLGSIFKGELPRIPFRNGEAIAVPYPAGALPEGDGLLAIQFRFFSRYGVPQDAATYAFTDLVLFNPATERLMLKTGNTWIAWYAQPTAGEIRFRFDESTVVYTDWRIENKNNATVLRSGTIAQSDIHPSDQTSPNPAAVARLVATSTQPYARLNATRRLINTLAPKLAFQINQYSYGDWFAWMDANQLLITLQTEGAAELGPHGFDLYHKRILNALNPVQHGLAR